MICIEQADAAHSATTDLINFDSTLFATPQTIALNSSNGSLGLSDSHPLTIQGPTGGTATLNGGDAIELLNIRSGTVSIGALTFSHGNNSGSYGGGVSNSGTLTLTNCGFDHDAASGGGGLFNASNTASAELVSCTFNHDTAVDGGGIYAFGKLTLTKCTFSNDVSTGVGGGGLWVSLGCKATVTSCIFDNDSTSEDGGGVFVYKTSTATFTELYPQQRFRCQRRRRPMHRRCLHRQNDEVHHQ